MKFNRTALLDLISTIEANEQAQADEYQEALEAYKARHKKKWIEEELPRIKALRDLFTQRLKTKSVITREDFQEAGFYNGRWSSDLNLNPYAEFTGATFTQGGKEYHIRTPRSPELVSLKAMLNSIEDETVSHTSLAGLGFRNLEWFFKMAARAQNEA